ncbi:unnamed protein product [Brachionus calyciflorus]|uniref:Uncharacterized protein n=1 Tax=Brachionus calyciflorus TaxID=104777 RepID=A0A814DC89_9BILA|nr:unnamed protein product [Brachionus calyciflorus]
MMSELAHREKFLKNCVVFERSLNKVEEKGEVSLIDINPSDQVELESGSKVDFLQNFERMNEKAPLEGKLEEKIDLSYVKIRYFKWIEIEKVVWPDLIPYSQAQAVQEETTKQIKSV